jgi:branched-chain amino acid aminotransferase
MAKNYCYFNGRITTLGKVKISPYDIGFLRGYGVFDVMCTQNGKPFLLSKHFARLKNSARELGIELPLSLEDYGKILKKILDLNGFKKSTIRTIVSGGISDNGFVYCGKPILLILIEKFQPLPAKVFEKGAGTITLDFERHIPKAKITNYVEAIRKQSLKEKKGSLEIIYLKSGKALEASTSNFFIIKDGKIITTKDNILLGVTRNLVLKLVKKKFKAEEREISVRELRNADEVFLTATNKDIVPVVRIDGRKVGDGKVGKNTKRVMEMFRDFVVNY